MALQDEEHYVGPTLAKSGLPAILDFDDKVLVFEDRVRGWQLEVGLDCYHKVLHGGFGALYITLSYFELIARYKAGSVDQNGAGAKFRDGFLDFATFTGFISASEYSAVRDLLYAGARCGLYHVGMTKAKVFIGGGLPSMFEFDITTGRLVIDPRLMIEAIKKHFQKYISDLANPSEVVLRSNFEKKFDHDILPQIS